MYIDVHLYIKKFVPENSKTCSTVMKRKNPSTMANIWRSAMAAGDRIATQLKIKARVTPAAVAVNRAAVSRMFHMSCVYRDRTSLMN